jgi:hypothetical protein
VYGVIEHAGLALFTVCERLPLLGVNPVAPL